MARICNVCGAKLGLKSAYNTLDGALSLCCKECASIAGLKGSETKQLKVITIRDKVYKVNPKQLTPGYFNLAKKRADHEEAVQQAMSEANRLKYSGYVFEGHYEDRAYFPYKPTAELINELSCEPVSFAFEPTNPHDSEAVKVMYQGRRVGYLFKGFVRDKVADALDNNWMIEAEVMDTIDTYDGAEDWHAPITLAINIYRPE